MLLKTGHGARLVQAVIVLGAAAAVLAVSVVLPRYVADLGMAVVPVALIATLAILALFVVPVHVLPALSLIVFALVPARVLPQDGPFGALPLTTIVLVVWALRRMLLGPTGVVGRLPDVAPPGTRFRTVQVPPFKAIAVLCGALFLLWGIFSMVRSTDIQTSFGWLTSFTAGALVALVVGDARREADGIRRAWLVLGGWLGAYAILEAALRANPVWGTLYTALGATDSQHWSVYRSEASFGHPLFAALFFAVACAIAVGTWLTTSSRWSLAAAIFSGLGLISTVSRGAMLAAAVASIFAFAASMLLRGEKRWGRFVALLVIGAAGILVLFQYDAFRARTDSTEAELSSQVRELGVWVAVQASELTGWLGSGPGTSGITGRLFDDVIIENSLLQLLISVGLPGLILFIGLIGAAFLHSLSRGAVAAAAGLLAYSISISGFNAIDALRPMHLLLGCLLILALNPQDPARPGSPSGFRGSALRSSRLGSESPRQFAKETA